MAFGGGPTPEQQRLQREQQEQIQKQKQQEDVQKRELASRQISAIRRLRGTGSLTGGSSGATPLFAALTTQGQGPGQTLG